MSEIISLLASLVSKTAIKEGKIDFLAKRYAQKFKAYIVDHNLAQFAEEEGPEALQIKQQNEQLLKTEAAKILTAIAAADPTDAQNKNDFTEWLLKQWFEMDNNEKMRFTEDAPTIKQNLAQFEEIRRTPAFKEKDAEGQPKNKTDINQYRDLPELRDVLLRFGTASARYALPELSATGNTVLYQDAMYIMWQVTDANDLVKLSSFPANNPPAWCTKGLSTAQSYLRTGPEYVAYRDGEPLFQIDPHDSSGKPQFMSRHNTRMHSSKMMNGEAADILNKVMTSGNLNEQAKKDLDYVLTIYKSPNLSDADTFEYLKEYVIVNGSAAKKDPKFLEIEQTYVKPRFLTPPHGMEPDEIRQLTNRYGRTGEATKDYVLENASMAKLAQKVEACPNFTDLVNKSPNGRAPNPEKFTQDEWGLIFRLDGLFKLAWAKFDTEFSFSTKFKEFKEAIKTQDGTKAGELATELISLLKTKFPGGSYGSAGRCEGFKVTFMTEHSGERTEDFSMSYPVKPYIATIEQLSKPFIKQGWEGAKVQAEALPEAKEAYEKLTAAAQIYKERINYDNLAWEARRPIDADISDSIKAIVTPKVKDMMAGLTKIQDVRKFVVDTFPNEMKSYRSGEARYNEDRIPQWAKPAILEKMNELRLLKETLRTEKEEKADRGEIKLRFSPKREYDKWRATRTPETPDPSDKVVDFILASPSYDWREKIDLATDMKDVHANVEAWIIANARSIPDYQLMQYLLKHHARQWPELEAAYPSILRDESYINMVYKGKRIPSKEPQFLNAVTYRQDLDSQIEYIKNHMGGKRWPELEAKIIATFNAGNWKDSDSYYGNSKNPSRLAEGILRYCNEVIKGRWKEVEPKFLEDETYAMKYIFRVIPDGKERIKRLMEEEQLQHESVPGEKTSSLRMLAKLKRLLERV